MSDERMIKNGNKTGENGKENCSEHVRRKKISLVLRPSMGQIYFTISFQNASVIRTRQILFSSFYTRQNRASEVKHLTWVSWSENGREHIWLAVYSLFFLSAGMHRLSRYVSLLSSKCQAQANICFIILAIFPIIWNVFTLSTILIQSVLKIRIDHCKFHVFLKVLSDHGNLLLFPLLLQL